MRTQEAYEEALTAADVYGELLGTLAVSYNNLLHLAEKVEISENHAAELRDQESAQKKAVSQLQKQMEVSRAKIQVIQDFLNRPENRDRARQRAELEQEIETQRGRMQEAEKQSVILEERRRYLSGLLQQQNETLQEAAWDEEALKQYFLEDLRLGLSHVSGDTLEQQAEEASGKVRPEDRERTP